MGRRVGSLMRTARFVVSKPRNLPPKPNFHSTGPNNTLSQPTAKRLSRKRMSFNHRRAAAGRLSGVSSYLRFELIECCAKKWMPKYYAVNLSQRVAMRRNRWRAELGGRNRPGRYGRGAPVRRSYGGAATVNRSSFGGRLPGRCPGALDRFCRRFRLIFRAAFTAAQTTPSDRTCSRRRTVI